MEQITYFWNDKTL